MRILLTVACASVLAACSDSSPPQAPAETAKPADSNASVEAAAPVKSVKSYDIETLLSNLRLSGAAISPDGSKVLYSSNQSGVVNVYEVPFGGGEAKALTQSTTESLYSIRYFPTDERVLYAADQGGNELDHVYVREADGSVKDLTPGEKFTAQFVDFTHDNKAFLIASNERDQRFFDLYLYQADGYARSMLFKNDAPVIPAAINRDLSLVAAVKPITTSDTDVILTELKTGKSRNLTEGGGVESNNVLGFTPDGKVLVASNRDSEFSKLITIDPKSGERSVLFESNWDVSFAQYSPDDRYLLVGSNVDARTELKLFESKSMTPVALPSVPAGDISGVNFSNDASKIAFYVASSRTPSSLFAATIGGEAKELVSALNAKIDPNDLVEGEVVRFKSYDGLEIPGIMYWPKGASADAKVPAMVWVHGGPGGQTRLNYSPLIQYLVNHGYAIYGINNRGSSGYGKSFFAADDRKHGEADLDDVVASKKMLIESGKVDGDKIGIIGGSYGGYMTLAALAFRPQEFKVGVNIFGVSNWIRTLESIPAWWEAQRQALYAELGDPAVDKERLTRISPLFHASNIVKPMLVLQGANDPRVLKIESDEIVEAVKKNKVPVEYVVFDDEGHGFVKRENEKRGYEAILKFLDQHLKAAK
jgi:dipeptidyl aminopeptidase/acylaminoacyl peptidase